MLIMVVVDRSQADEGCHPGTDISVAQLMDRYAE